MKTCCTPTANAIKEKMQPILALSDWTKSSVTRKYRGRNESSRERWMRLILIIKAERVVWTIVQLQPVCCHFLFLHPLRQHLRTESGDMVSGPTLKQIIKSVAFSRYSTHGVIISVCYFLLLLFVLPLPSKFTMVDLNKKNKTPILLVVLLLTDRSETTNGKVYKFVALHQLELYSSERPPCVGMNWMI